MNVPINEVVVEKLKDSQGQQTATLDELKQICQLLGDKRAKALVIDKNCYVVFRELINVEFCVRSLNKRSQLHFIPSQDLEFINATETKTGYFLFLANEFFQGNTFWSRLKRFAITVAPLVALNLVIWEFAGSGGLKDIFSGILAAVSIFVAIFSLFTTSHDYLMRKRLALFEKGKLGYYFSVDKHITKTGIYTILVSILCLIITSGYSQSNNAKLDLTHLQDALVWAGLNLTFLGVYLTLRSIVEFYINRPASFIMGDLKRDSFNKYRSTED